MPFWKTPREKETSVLDWVSGVSSASFMTSFVNAIDQGKVSYMAAAMLLQLGS